MFRTLTNIEIIEAEAIYLCISWNVIPKEKQERAMENLKNKNWEQYVYLEWLLLRWTVLRKHPEHLPARLQLIV